MIEAIHGARDVAASSSIMMSIDCENTAFATEFDVVESENEEINRLIIDGITGYFVW